MLTRTSASSLVWRWRSTRSTPLQRTEALEGEGFILLVCGFIGEKETQGRMRVVNVCERENVLAYANVHERRTCVRMNDERKKREMEKIYYLKE